MNLHIINRLKKQFNNNEIFKNYYSIIILLTYCYFWISIGKYVEINFNEFLNNGLIYLVIFSCCLFVLIIKLIINRNLPTLSILMIYPVASSIGYFNNINFHQDFDFLIHFFFTISALFIFFSILEDYKDRKKLFKYFFKISLIFISLVFIIIVFPDFAKRVINNIHVRDINFVTLNLLFFDYTYIQNSNGASRVVTLLFIFFFTKFIFKIKKNKKYNKYLFLSILLSILIFYYQSRLSIIFIVIYVLLWILTFSNKNFFYKIIFFVNIIVVPFILQNTYNFYLETKNLETKNLETKNLETKQLDNKKIIEKYIGILDSNRLFNINTKISANHFHAFSAKKLCKFSTNYKFIEIIDRYSSGRICGWEILLRDIDKKDIIFGKGFFYDQKFLKRYQKISSNTFINIIYNSGLLGSFPLLFIFIILINKYKVIYDFYKKSNYDYFLMFNLILFLLFRGFFEDTLAFVSIDLILFLTCSFILFSKIKELQNNKN